MPRSKEDILRERQSQMVTDTVASQCMDTVLKTMFLRCARVELTLSACAHANKLMLSPCKL